MESADLRLQHHHQHQLQQQFAEYSSLSTHSAAYKVSNTLDLNPSTTLNSSAHNMFLTESIPNSRDQLWSPSIRTSMIQELGGLCDGTSTYTQQSANELLLANIKAEMPDSFPRLSEMIYSPSDVDQESHFLATKHRQQCSYNLSENLWPGYSSGQHVTELQLLTGELYSNAQNSANLGNLAPSGRCNCSHIFPSTDISSLDLCSSLASGYLNLSLQSLDLLASTYRGDSSSQMPMDHDRSHELKDGTHAVGSRKEASGFVNGVKRIKRPSSLSDSKESHAEAKKQRPMSRSSCPPLKVRKEKLGDRITALQRLVAPFGKTDTASVLTEAIGYIQFLHDQVQTLSLPYLKTFHSKAKKTMQMKTREEDGKEEAKRDLRSRGICLVPLSCVSYPSSYNDGI